MFINNKSNNWWTLSSMSIKSE